MFTLFGVTVALYFGSPSSLNLTLTQNVYAFPCFPWYSVFSTIIGLRIFHGTPCFPRLWDSVFSMGLRVSHDWNSVFSMGLRVSHDWDSVFFTLQDSALRHSDCRTPTPVYPDNSESHGKHRVSWKIQSFIENM